MTSLRLAVLPFVLACCVAVAPAGAQAPPAPGCEGLLFEDPAGDQRVNAIPLSGSPPTPAPAKDNVDIRAGWINYATDAAGKVTVTANIQVTNLTREREQGAFALIYNFQWTDEEGANRFAQATVDDSSATFTFGTAGQQGYTEEGTTKGKLHEGPNGVVSIELPRAVAPAGKTLSATNANAANVYGDPGLTYFFPENDAAAGKDYRVAACPGAASPAPAPAPAPPAQQATAFEAGARPATLKASKVSRARKVTFNIDAREELRGARFTFKRGSRTLARARRATFTNGRVAFKLRKRGLKRGTYALVVTGTRANGAAARDTIRIRVK